MENAFKLIKLRVLALQRTVPRVKQSRNEIGKVHLSQFYSKYDYIHSARVDFVHQYDARIEFPFDAYLPKCCLPIRFDGWQKISFGQCGRVKYVAIVRLPLRFSQVNTYIHIGLVKLETKIKCISARPLKVTWDILCASDSLSISAACGKIFNEIADFASQLCDKFIPKSLTCIAGTNSLAAVKCTEQLPFNLTHIFQRYSENQKYENRTRPLHISMNAQSDTQHIVTKSQR